MLSNIHTHTTFSDGKNTPEEVVLAAIERGFVSIGFSDHSFTGFDTSYCISDNEGYISTINDLKEKYKNDIQIYLGIEEDAHAPLKHPHYDYVIGSSHYCLIDGVYYPVDSSDGFSALLKIFEADQNKMAQAYYESFTSYILKYKPDIVGHFDLITKYDELNEPHFLSNKKYNEIAEGYLKKVVNCGSVFELNTGAISRGYRKTPYPANNLLRIIKENDAPVILSADSHDANSIDGSFNESKAILRDIGFTHAVCLYNGEFVKYKI